MNCFPIAVQYGQSTSDMQDDIDFAVEAFGSIFDISRRVLAAMNGSSAKPEAKAELSILAVTQNRYINQPNHRLTKYNSGSQAKIRAIH